MTDTDRLVTAERALTHYSGEWFDPLLNIIRGLAQEVRDLRASAIKAEVELKQLRHVRDWTPRSVLGLIDRENDYLARKAAEAHREALEAQLVEQRSIGHGEGQEHTIADVNAGRIDDLIAPRLQAHREALQADLEEAREFSRLQGTVTGNRNKRITELEQDVRDLRASQEKSVEALEFAQGAILDAIGLEEGLDGAAGEAVIRMIRAALTATGRALMPFQTDESHLEAGVDSYVEQRLHAADAHREALEADIRDLRASVQAREAESVETTRLAQTFLRQAHEEKHAAESHREALEAEIRDLRASQEAEREAWRLRAAALQDSIDGCAQHVATLNADRLAHRRAKDAAEAHREAQDVALRELVATARKLTPSDHPTDKRALIVSRYYHEELQRQVDALNVQSTLQAPAQDAALRQIVEALRQEADRIAPYVDSLPLRVIVDQLEAQFTRQETA